MHHEIKDITEKGMDFKRLRIVINDKGHINMSSTPFGRDYGENISIECTPERLKQLALDILTNLGIQAQIKEWKPTFEELEAQIDKRSDTNGLDFWFIDMLRSSYTINNEKKMKQIYSIYEWMKGNEDWLYRRGVYASLK